MARSAPFGNPWWTSLICVSFFRPQAIHRV
ncbi:MAG: hypothetical protein BWY76_03218 [bacterium ADurb.Bin429]|nr:MAG: hypothetical protein BWY76_03218 [bacterium ADurb.Bin429]